MSDLLERYLSAVERRLPKEQAKDIVAELREALASKIEAKEAELGRAAAADEIASILKAYGHPVVVASRYSGHDYLIGPSVYPWFWHVQRIAVGMAIAITFAIVAVRALGSEEPVAAAFRGFGSALQAALITFGVVTALFIGAERTKLDMKWIEKWDPKKLPREQVREPKSLFESAIALGFDVVFILWWAKVVNFPNEMPVKDAGAVAVQFSSAWADVYYPVLVLGIGAALVHAWDLLHPAWSRLRSTVRIAGHVAGLAVLWVMMRAQPLIEVTGVQGAKAEEVDRVFRTVDGVLHISLGAMGFVWAITIGVEIWRQVQASRPKTMPAMSLA